jgi:hypothetical protein
VRRLKGGHCLLPRHGRELVEELIEAVASLEIVDQVPERDPGPDEDWGTPKDFGVAMNDGWT